MISNAAQVIEQRNLPERVAAALLDRITGGMIGLGSRIRETVLSEELGVSRPTLREGLRLLEARGVVQSIPQRGCFVRQYDPRSIVSIYMLREAAEMRAIELLLEAPARVAALAADLDRIIEAMAAKEKGPTGSLNRLDIEFHTAVVEASGEFALISVWESIKHHLAIIFSLELVDGRGFARDHENFRSALLRGDRQELAAEYKRHVAKDRLDVG